MVVDSGKNKYYVRWFHNQQGTEQLPPNTLCEIKVRDGEVYHIESVGVAKMYFKEKQFNKDLGRKISLTKALKKLFPNPSEKYVRYSFWDAYYKMRNNKW